MGVCYAMAVRLRYVTETIERRKPGTRKEMTNAPPVEKNKTRLILSWFSFGKKFEQQILSQACCFVGASGMIVGQIGCHSEYAPVHIWGT